VRVFVHFSWQHRGCAGGSVAGVELVVELLEVLEDLLHMGGGVDEIGDAEVISVLLLSEARPWHRHDPRLVHHLHAVDKVRLLALLVCLVDEALREMNFRESVHGALNLSARDIFHVIEGFSEESSTLLHAFEDLAFLLLIKLNAFCRLAAEVWLVDHELDGHLANCIRAQLDRLELVEHLLGTVAQIVVLHVAATEAALTHHTL